VSAPTTDHPLSGFADISASGAVAIQARPHAGVLILRASPDEARAAVEAALDGLPLPERCGETGAAGAVLALWRGPDEWMIITPPGEEAMAAARLRDALDTAHHQLTVLSDNYALISIDGAKALALLAKLVTIDLHPRAFPPGRCASTLLAKANVLLWRAAEDAGDPPDASRFRVIVRASHADYVWRLLADAAREWGATPLSPPSPLPIHGAGLGPGG